jgi:hypothetical protein
MRPPQRYPQAERYAQAAAGLPGCRIAVRVPRLAGLAAAPWAFTLVLAVLLAAAGWWVAQGPLHHDCALYLFYTGRYLDGARLYTDIAEINPPLAFWLTVPPVWAARQLAAAPGPDLLAAVFVAYVVALAGLSLLLAQHLARGLPGLPPRRRQALLLAAFAVLVPGAVAVFGEREHLLVILTLPYLFLAARRTAGGRIGWPLAAAVGLLAAAGFLLKPYFLIVPLALEIHRLASAGPTGASGAPARWRRPIRPETVALGLAGLAYALAILLATPAYLQQIVPLLTATYQAYESPLRDVLVRPEVVWFLVAAGLLGWGWRSGSSRGALPDTLLLAAAGWLAAYVLQSKAWIYELYPASALLALWFAALGLPAGPADPRPSQTRRMLRCAALIGLIGLMAIMAGRGHYRNPFDGELEAAVRARPGTQSIYIFASQVSAAFPLVFDEQLAWPSRFPHLWPLPALAADAAGLSDARRAMLARARRYAIDSVVADLGAAPPDVVAVDRRADKPYFSDRFDFLAFFLADPRFAALWRHYAPDGETPHFLLFRRRPEAAGAT